MFVEPTIDEVRREFYASIRRNIPEADNEFIEVYWQQWVEQKMEEYKWTQINN